MLNALVLKPLVSKVFGGEFVPLAFLVEKVFMVLEIYV